MFIFTRILLQTDCVILGVWLFQLSFIIYFFEAMECYFFEKYLGFLPLNNLFVSILFIINLLSNTYFVNVGQFIFIFILISYFYLKLGLLGHIDI